MGLIDFLFKDTSMFRRNLFDGIFYYLESDPGDLDPVHNWTGFANTAVTYALPDGQQIKIPS
jgi:hypothetical protein